MNESIKILLIEDDTVDRIFFERALKASDIKAELLVAEDAESGIETFCREEFTCVFLDYMLPGTDGLSLLERLHSEKTEIPIILITSHGDEKIAVNAIKAGAMDYIPKNSITPLSLSQIIRNVVRFKEIEKQKIHAENIAKQNEERHRIFFEKSQIFLCTHDLEGNFINVNEAGAKSLGYLPQELIGTNLNNIIPQAHKPLFIEYLKSILDEKTAMGLMRVMTKNSEERIWMYHNYLYEEGLNESYVIGSIQDITERVKMEEEMREAKLLAEESVKIKEQFLANMSHEIRTPMSAIIGFARLILDTPLNEEQKEYLNTINYSAKNLLSIINDILDFSKIKSGKLALEESDFNLSTTLSSITSVFQPEAEKKNIQLSCRIDPEIPVLLKGDSVRLNQILMNLYSNAIKFTEKGYVKLDVKLSGKKDDFNNLSFSVEDSGIGIPDNKLASVFESFTQASSDTTRKYGGTGLGLAIVKDLVELHGGTIKAFSHPGKGTRFVFNLFLKESVILSSGKSASIEYNDTVSQADLKGIKVLLTEDNKFNQLLAKRILEKGGCEVEIAENGREAVEKLKVSSYDIVLMDIQMPEMDGYAATLVIRTQLGEKVKNVPIIAMTAHALNDEGSKCILAGMNDYISKPFDRDILFSKIIHLTNKVQNNIKKIENDGVSAGMENESLDLTHLKTVLADNDEVLVEILATLSEELPAQTENLKRSALEKNKPQLAQDAHKLRSCIMMIGMPKFLTLVEAIEKQANEGSDMDVLFEMANQAVTKCYETTSKVKVVLQKLQATTVA